MVQALPMPKFFNDDVTEACLNWKVISPPCCLGAEGAIPSDVSWHGDSRNAGNGSGSDGTNVTAATTFLSFILLQEGMQLSSPAFSWATGV